ncbi:glycerophosphodiester phosphodiesterase family protein [Oscillospiraceae bacterium PP1C4]
MAEKRYINYAHRGASEYAPENTFAAFYLGQYMGANGIETDVRETFDGNLVLFCGEKADSLEQIAGLPGSIYDYTYEQLLQADFGIHKGKQFQNEQIVLLEDFLKYFGRKELALAIEIKVTGIEERVMEMIYRSGCREKVTITSFILPCLERIRGFDEKVRLGFLTTQASEELMDKLVEKRINQYCPSVCALDAAVIAYARSKGLSVRAWGVRTVEDMKNVLTYDTDGMTINFPDKLTEELERRYGKR